jgi:hypothetical protein
MQEVWVIGRMLPGAQPPIRSVGRSVQLSGWNECVSRRRDT